MDRFVILVDAGYFLRQSLEILSGRTSHDRRDLVITSVGPMLESLVQKTRAVLDIPTRELLRVYWYDGVMPTGQTPQQKAIVALPDVLFRAGTVNSHGQQKGVDSLIVTDLIELASNRAICDAALVTGDADLAVGIEIAQKKGVRIAVLGLEDLAARVYHNQSYEITNRADRIGRLGASDLTPYMHFKAPTATPAAHPAVPAPGSVAPTPAAPAPPPPVPASPKSPAPAAGDDARIEALVRTFIAGEKDAKKAVDPATKAIEASMDRTLLYSVYTGLGRKFTGREKILIRETFRKELGF
jgi:uncharacterized LabA/DUF88 family protein